MFAHLDLPPRPTSAGAVRRWLRSSLATWGMSAVEDDAMLLTSELVTNSLLHARTPITVALRTTDGRLRIEVCDQSPVPPALRSFSPESGTGRGLRLVAEIAISWGFDPWGDPDLDGKSVWFEIAAPADADMDRVVPAEGTTT